MHSDSDEQERILRETALEILCSMVTKTTFNHHRDSAFNAVELSVEMAQALISRTSTFRG